VGVYLYRILSLVPLFYSSLPASDIGPRGPDLYMYKQSVRTHHNTQHCSVSNMYRLGQSQGNFFGEVCSPKKLKSSEVALKGG